MIGMVSIDQRDCDKPGCSQGGQRTYKGKHGNTLHLCRKHYYALVSGRSSPEFSGIGAELDNPLFRTQPEGQLRSGVSVKPDLSLIEEESRKSDPILD